jgi:hypothetical protein
MKFLLYICDSIVRLANNNSTNTADIKMRAFLLTSIIISNIIFLFFGAFYMLLISKGLFTFSKVVVFLLIAVTYIVTLVSLRQTYSQNYLVIVNEKSSTIGFSNKIIILLFSLFFIGSTAFFAEGLLALRSVLY